MATHGNTTNVIADVDKNDYSHIANGRTGRNRLVDIDGHESDEKPVNDRHDENVDSDGLKAEAVHILERDTNIESRILRKLDYRIIPFLFGIWLCAFIDRSNIGNARVDGLTEDLHLRGTMFNVALGRSLN